MRQRLDRKAPAVRQAGVGVRQQRQLRQPRAHDEVGGRVAEHAVRCADDDFDRLVAQRRGQRGEKALAVLRQHRAERDDDAGAAPQRLPRKPVGVPPMRECRPDEAVVRRELAGFAREPARREEQDQVRRDVRRFHGVDARIALHGREQPGQPAARRGVARERLPVQQTARRRRRPREPAPARDQRPGESVLIDDQNVGTPCRDRGVDVRQHRHRHRHDDIPVEHRELGGQEARRRRARGARRALERGVGRDREPRPAVRYPRTRGVVRHPRDVVPTRRELDADRGQRQHVPRERGRHEQKAAHRRPRRRAPRRSPSARRASPFTPAAARAMRGSRRARG